MAADPVFPIMIEPIKRLTCCRCQRPQRTCICDFIAPTAHTVEVLILQHPLEVHNAKGSVRLLNLSLAHSVVMVGEVFAEQQLQQRLALGGKFSVLLYPDSAGNDSLNLSLSLSPTLDPALLQQPSALRLVVLDGTWRKSRKMLYLNPLLQQLPRLALRDMPASQYLIRKAHVPEQLSTLEATCHALMQLEKDCEKYQPLLNAFTTFVEQQRAYSGR